MGNYRKTKVVLRAVTVLAVFFIITVVRNDYTYADPIVANPIVEGGGNVATGTATSCPGFIDGYERLCDYNDTGSGELNGSGGGGASWHIYETSGSNAYAGPVIEGSGWGIVDGKTTINNIKQECTSKKGADWYVAFGWEGSRKMRHYNRLTGPIHREPYSYTPDGKPDPSKPNLLAMENFDDGSRGSGWQYNDYGALSYDDIKTALDEGGDLSNQRISWDAATALYNEHYGKNLNRVPDDVGYFCVGSGDLGGTFAGGSAVSEGTAKYGDVAEANKAYTKLTRIDKDVLHIMECNNDDGCAVRFSHYLKRKTGTGSAEYTVSRVTNTTSLNEKPITSTEYFSGIANGTTKRVYSPTLTLMPGQSVCETMKFDIDDNNNKATTTACVYVKGTVGSGISAAVRNITLSTDWVKTVYAKPNDKIALWGWYKPSCQYAYNNYVDKTTIDGLNRGAGFVGGVFSRYVSPGWNNAFSINLNDTSFNTINVPGTIGESSSYSKEVNDAYSVKANDVGKKIEEKVATNTSGILTTPNAVNFYVDTNKIFQATVYKNQISDSAYIIVPYNYENTTSIKTPDDAVVYAGEEKKIDFDITVGKKRNYATNGTYATIVPKGKWKLEVCNERGTWCKETDASTGTLNEGGNLEGGSISKDITINVPDWSAGTKMCVRPAVYPANSGTDINYTDTNGSGTWRYSSERACYTVAKKPSFQVWGGNIYSARSITTSVAGKTNLDGYVDYNVNTKNSSKRYVFGSWGELGVIATGKVKGLASGAGTGYSEAGRIADPGGSKEAKMSYCNRTKLSFANVDCDKADAYTGGIMSGDAMSTAINDKKNILENLIAGNDTVNMTDSYVDLSADDEDKLTDKGIYHYNSGASDLEIGKAEISYGKKIVVHSEGNITISGDLKHYEYGEYSSLNNVSRLIIYGKNIKINCGVSQVDALLVADEEVNTCVDDKGETPDVNDGLRSKQLLINGAVIAGKVSMNRTYGAATGDNSIEPAEIINFDSTFYLWGARESSIAESGKISTISITELSPRY